MIIFGLAGGVASGKSTVAGLLVERGAVALDADRHAHAVLDEPSVRSAALARWGEGVVDPAGALRRGEIARRVFGEGPTAEADRRFLEGLVHPRVRELLRRDLAVARAAGAPAAVLDVPLLFEAGWADQCDAVLFVDTPEPLRQRRAAQRGWPADGLAQRERAQLPIEEKRRRADLVVPGDSLEGARRGVEQAWRQWVDGSSASPPPAEGGRAGG